VDCPAGLIPGVLALYPQLGNGSRTRSRSSFPSAGRDGHAVAPQEPVYSWLLPTPTCARTAVSKTWGVEGLSLGVSPWFVTRFLPGLLARSLRPGAPCYRLLNGPEQPVSDQRDRRPLRHLDPVLELGRSPRQMSVECDRVPRHRGRLHVRRPRTPPLRHRRRRGLPGRGLTGSVASPTARRAGQPGGACMQVHAESFSPSPAYLWAC